MFKKHQNDHMAIASQLGTLRVDLDITLEQILKDSKQECKVDWYGIYSFGQYLSTCKPVPTLKGKVDLLMSKLEALEQYLKVSYQEPKTLNVKGEYTKK